MGPCRDCFTFILLNEDFCLGSTFSVTRSTFYSNFFEHFPILIEVYVPLLSEGIWELSQRRQQIWVLERVSVRKNIQSCGPALSFIQWRHQICDFTFSQPLRLTPPSKQQIRRRQFLSLSRFCVKNIINRLSTALFSFYASHRDYHKFSKTHFFH